MNLNSEISYVVQTIIRGLPTLVACFLIIAIAIARYRTCPKAAGLAVTAGVLKLLVFFSWIGFPYLFRLMSRGGSGVGQALSTGVGFGINLLDAAALTMLVIAVFIERRQQ